MGARNRKANLPSLTMDDVSIPAKGQGVAAGYIQRTHSDLRADPRYQRESEKFLTWLAENESAYEKITGGLVSSDIFETLRDEEGRLGTAVDRARIMRDAPEDIKETYKYLSEEFEASKAGNFGEILKATWDRGIDLIADPINLTFAVVAPGIGSAATKASTAAAQKVLTSSGGKAAAKRTLNNVAASSTGTAAAFEGGAWTGIENFYRQDKNISLGIQDSFSKGDFALATGAGVVLGGGLGYGFGRVFGDTPTLIDNFNDSPKAAPKKKIDFNDPETPKPEQIEHRKLTPGTEDTPATETIETTTINWGPVLDDGKPRVRSNGTPVYATTRRDAEGNFLSIDIDDVALREAFDNKPWTKSQVPGVTPLKENDIQSPEEWIMFNLFHERNHVSYSRPEGMPTAIYENGANVAALKDLKIWRETQKIESLTPVPFGPANFNPEIQAKLDATLANTFDRAKVSVDPNTGDSFFNRLLNPEVEENLLNRIVAGLKDKDKNIVVMLPEVDAANMILAIKNIITKQGDDGAEIGLNTIAPQIQTAVRDYNFNDDQLKRLVDEIGDTYFPARKQIVGDKEGIFQPRLSDDEMRDLSNQLANDMGGSSKNTGTMLLDEIQNLNADGSLNSLQIKNSLASKAYAQAQKYLATSIGGFLKAANILNPSRRLAPNTLYALQRTFSSEMGQAWNWKTAKGAVAVRQEDYGFYANRRFGTWQTAWRDAYDGIKVNSRGATREELDGLISNAVRKNSMRELNQFNFATPEAKKAVVDSIKVLQDLLPAIGKEGRAKGVLRNRVDNYLPRLWLRDKVESNKEEFINLVMQKNGVKGINTREEAAQWVEETLDIKYQFGNEYAGGGNSFFANRKLDIGDETIFNDFLDTDLDRVMTSYFSSAAKSIAKKDKLNVRNLEEFNNIWLTAIEKEMKQNGATGAEISRAKKDASYLYKNVTGEDMDRFGTKTQNTIEFYMLANRLALLPLATLSSITEIFINMSKAGVGTTMRGFKDAVMGGSKKMYDDSYDVLRKVHGMSKAETKHELNQIGTALDQASADSIERFSGDQLSNAKMRKVSNAFFKLTLLEQWTKTVQLTSYRIGKRLITENIENLASKAALVNKGQISKRMQRQIDELADFGIDYKDGINWYNAGAKLDDPFYLNIKKGGGMYTNEVILNPSSQSGLKPTFMSNPKTAVLGQLLGYPAAFTNTVLKGMMKQTVRDPQTFFTQHVPAAAVMTGVAAFANGIRSNGESWEDKEGFEIAVDGLVRWGGNGVLADMVKRGSESAQYYQEPLAYFTGTGVVAGDVYNLVRQGDVMSFFGGKVPGRGAVNAIFGPFEATEDFPKDYTDWLRDMDRRIADSIVPERKAKGGLVDNVVQVAEEPDERIDRMTGFPYNIQAGGAFIDEEDRQEFKKGGKVLNSLHKNCA